MKFTDLAIKNLKPADKKYYKRESGGFTIRVLPTGVKTWLYIYTIEGKRRELNLGLYPDVSLADAREKHADAVKLFRNGKDPGIIAAEAKEVRRNALTVEELVDEYIKKHAMPNKRGWKEDKRILEHDVLVAWKKYKAEDITKRDVVLLLEGIVERGAPGSANNNFKIIRRMFNFAVERDILKFSPCFGVKMPGPINRKDRHFDEDETRLFWKNIDACRISEDVCRALKLILVTAQRPGEITGMHTREIKGKWWTIPVERSKNKQAHHVYLTQTALDLIGPLEVFDKDTKKMKPTGYILKCPHDKKDQPIGSTSLDHAVLRNLALPVMLNGEQIYDKAGEPVTENKLGVDKFTPHDLRRTAATFLSKIGFMDEIIDAVLNHTKQGVIRTYNINRYDKEIQMALSAWERKLNSIITNSEYIVPEGNIDNTQKTPEDWEREYAEWLTKFKKWETEQGTQ